MAGCICNCRVLVKVTKICMFCSVSGTKYFWGTSFVLRGHGCFKHIPTSLVISQCWWKQQIYSVLTRYIFLYTQSSSWNASSMFTFGWSPPFKCVFGWSYCCKFCYDTCTLKLLCSRTFTLCKHMLESARTTFDWIHVQ